MAKNKLFKDLEVKNNVSRNGFDLSSNVKFTAKCGELLPVMHRTLMYGDEIKLNLSSFTRTSPVDTAAYTQIREYVDVFFVPYRLIGKQIPHILSQDKDNPTIAFNAISNSQIGTKLPQIPFSKLYYFTSTPQTSEPGYVQKLMYYYNNFGFNRGVQSIKLLNHLGYCYFNLDNTRRLLSNVKKEQNAPTYTNPFGFKPNVSILPLACYQKIYYDFYRNTQWENNQPYNYNFDYLNSTGLFWVDTKLNVNSDYWNNPTIFDLRYSNYPKDLFYGIIPNSQYGDEAIVEIDQGGTPTSTNWLPLSTDSSQDIDKKILVGNSIDGTEQYSIMAKNSNEEATSLADRSELGVTISNLAQQLGQSFSILSLRKSQFLQKYKEIIGSGSKDYQSIIAKIFNVDIPDTLADHCQYLGGYTSNINISEVVNNNLAGDNQADIKGKGQGSSQSDTISFRATEAGHLMVIYHAQPVIDYALNSFHFDVTKVDVDDYANPVFDKLGFQELPSWYLDNTSTTNAQANPMIGYAPRYYDYKTSVDVTLGDFRETRTTWISPVSFDYLKEYVENGIIKIDMNFFKVSPKILDTIFVRAVDDFVDTDQLLVNLTIGFHAVRSLDYIGVPY